MTKIFQILSVPVEKLEDHKRVIRGRKIEGQKPMS